MNETSSYEFGIRVDSDPEGFWSFGSCLSHNFGQTYLFINFAKWHISIGWLMKEGAEEHEQLAEWLEDYKRLLEGKNR